VAVNVVSSGSQSATISTEHSLYSTTSAKTLWLEVDLSNLAAGDVVTLIVYKKVRSSDTKQIAFQATYAGAQSLKVSISPPVGSAIYWEAALKQNAGTGRSFSWSVNEYA
jgi:hypothetical protein